jgi:hypothetical protein
LIGAGGESPLLNQGKATAAKTNEQAGDAMQSGRPFVTTNPVERKICAMMKNEVTTIIGAEFERVRRIVSRAADGVIFPDYSKEFQCVPPEQAERGLEAITTRVTRYVVDNGLDPDEVGERAIKVRLHYELCSAFGRAPPAGVVIAKKGFNFGLQSEWNPRPWEWQDPDTIPRLESLYGGHYWRGEVGATAASGGIGKSILGIVEALAGITGKPLLGEATRGGLKVMLMNYEDSELVLRQRVTAAMLRHGVSRNEIAGRLYVESIDSDMMRFAKVSSDGAEIVEPNIARLTEVIRSRGLDIVILDPWVSVHEVDGNLGHLVQPIITAFKGIAQATNAAIELVAHPRKTGGHDLTDEDVAGSLTLVNKLRSLRVLNRMTEEAAAKYGLAPWEAGDFFRVDNPKHTHGPSAQPKWIRKVSVGLGNSGQGMFDHESMVGVVTPWSPPTTESLVDGLTPEQIAAIKAEVRAGTDREDPRADDWAGKAAAKVLGLDIVDKGQRAKAKITLTALTKAGHFKPEKRQSKSAKGRKCVHLVPADPAPLDSRRTAE